MANLAVGLLRQIKVSEAYTAEQTAAIRSLCTPAEFKAFTKSLETRPWRACRIDVGANRKYDLKHVTLPGAEVGVVVDGKRTVKSIPGPKVAVEDCVAGSYHLDYRESGIRKRPTVLSILAVKYPGTDPVNTSIADGISAAAVTAA